MYKPIALTILFIGASLHPVNASTKNLDGKSCANIAENVKRLECYDTIFMRKKQTIESTQNDPIGERISLGNWDVRTETSPIDDSNNVYIKLESITTHRDRFGRETKSWFMITCRENTTSFYVNFADNFMSSLNGLGVVTYRVDQYEAKTKSFTESNDHSVLGLWSGGRSIPFIKSLFGGTDLVLRATPHNESKVTAKFNISGIKNAVSQVRDACSW